MGNLLESYKVLGVKMGAGMADITTSYRQLCRRYHPDISEDPDAEEQMKQINIAYTVLREKFRREAAFRERQPITRPARRYPATEPKTEPKRQPSDARAQAAEAQRQKATEYAAQRAAERETEREAQRAVEREVLSAEAERKAYAVLHGYFKALNTYNYANAYSFLSTHDKKHINLESFIQWRESVARLYPMREFRIAGGSSIAVVTWGGNKTYHARKFRIIITEDNYSDNATILGDVDKLVINESGEWGVFLGYRELNELTRAFDKRFENKKKREIKKRWEEYYTGLHPEFNMLNMEGMRKTVSKELYRQRRYGGAMTFAVISVKHSGARSAVQEELQRSAAKTINSVLRETDIPAYAGDGVFAIMFIELGRRNAETIIDRLIETIRKNAGPQLGANANIEYGYNSWTGNRHADMDTLKLVLEKFSKKI